MWKINKHKMRYNHHRPLKDFKKDIEIIRNAGFKPIAVTQMYFEDTFVFETDEEADEAYTKLERDENGNEMDLVCGWWHGKEDFKKEVEKYESKEGASKVKIYWLKI